MKTFSIQILGCRVNHYEGQQLAATFRSRGFQQVPANQPADIRVVHTCSVTTEAATKSRQAVRRATRQTVPENSNHLESGAVVVTGCWATSDSATAEAIPGVTAVITHHDDVASKLVEFFTKRVPAPSHTPVVGTRSLPLLGERQTGHQRAFLKVQDGCDAHCTYCIIPQLRPSLWSKPIDDAVSEASQLVESGHRELVLTGIFLGAYGQPTALRRRQVTSGPLGELIDALCSRVKNLRRLRLSSLEPGDLTPELIETLKSHPQVVPHFHLPLQSGSDHILHRMNRQYTRDEFLRMAEMVQIAFDRPAITTDIITGFPGETDDDFNQTLDVVKRVGFLHIHAFPFSPRPGTAAARWTKDFVNPSVASARISELIRRADAYSLQFRQQFIGSEVELLVERNSSDDRYQNGRCERYFDVHFDQAFVEPGAVAQVRVDRVTPQRTFATLLSVNGAAI